MDNLGARPLATAAVYCSMPSLHEIIQFSWPLFAAIMYLNKYISAYSKKFIIVLSTIIFIIIIFVTLRM